MFFEQPLGDAYFAYFWLSKKSSKQLEASWVFDFNEG